VEDADYCSVPGLTFADELDAALREERREPRTATWSTSSFTSRHVSPCLFLGWSDPARPYRATTNPRAAQAFTVTPIESVSATRHREPETIKRQQLTDIQRSALDTLIGLGAELADDFTVKELRQVYRRLARRLHPDSNPAGAASERERMSLQFGDAATSYQRLVDSLRHRH
jgi:hypothetical protein